tara:strand:- start:463 stop:813 length:351 start_codon:yes stop_codon:yes gene_type:complete
MESITKYKSVPVPVDQENIIPSLIQQIKKDFALQGYPIDDFGVEPVQFFNLLYSKTQEFIESDFPALLNILYRIDISERKVSSRLSVSESDTAKVLIELIVEREIQKINLRNRFNR